MIKKDYELIADVINESIKAEKEGTFTTIKDLAKNMAYQLQAENPRFDIGKFLGKCYQLAG